MNPAVRSVGMSPPGFFKSATAAAGTAAERTEKPAPNVEPIFLDDKVVESPGLDGRGLERIAKDHHANCLYGKFLADRGRHTHAAAAGARLRLGLLRRCRPGEPENGQ